LIHNDIIMGCQYSVEEATTEDDDYRIAHLYPSFLIDESIHPTQSSGQTVDLTVKKHIWKSNDSSNVYRTPSPSEKTSTTTNNKKNLQPFDAILALSDSPHELLLKNKSSGRTVAVLKHIEGRHTHTFKIYTFRSFQGNQTQKASLPPSRIHQNGQPLFEWAEVVEQTKDGDQFYTMNTSDGVSSYKAVRAGPMLGVRQLKIFRNDLQCGRIREDPHWSDAEDVYQLTVGPGIDPCLLVSLTAIIDEMIEMTKQEDKEETEQRHQRHRQDRLRYQQQQILMNDMNNDNS